jgi:carbon catabolite-derepressing protein kinase
MLTVDPLKRYSVQQVIQSPFHNKDLPNYLSPSPVPAGPFLGSLSNLVSQSKALNFEMIDGLGMMEESVVDQLTALLKDVDKEEIWDALRRADRNGKQNNSVKVAYLMLRDKIRVGKNREFQIRSSSLVSLFKVAEYEEREREAQIAAIDVRVTFHRNLAFNRHISPQIPSLP